ncbi:MAG: hypothetical protein ACR2HF_11665 [Methylococcaceae bacterium]
MASGTLGTVMTTASSYVGAYTATTSISYATISINLVNTDATNQATIRVAIVSGTDATAASASTLTSDGVGTYKKYHIEYGAVVAANGGVLERTCIPVSAGDKVFVWSDTAAVAVRVFGLEQAA